MFFLLFYLYHLEAVVAVFEGKFLVALLDVVSEKFRDFDVLMAVFAVCQKFALSR